MPYNLHKLTIYLAQQSPNAPTPPQTPQTPPGLPHNHLNTSKTQQQPISSHPSTRTSTPAQEPSPLHKKPHPSTRPKPSCIECFPSDCWPLQTYPASNASQVTARPKQQTPTTRGPDSHQYLCPLRRPKNDQSCIECFPGDCQALTNTHDSWAWQPPIPVLWPPALAAQPASFPG